MQTGKIASQCSHATLGLYKDLLRSKDASVKRMLLTWDELGGNKDIFTVHLSQLFFS